MPAGPAPHVSHVPGRLSRDILDGADLVALLVSAVDDELTVPTGLDAVVGVDLAAFAAQESAKGSAAELTTLTLPPVLDGDAPWAGLPARVLLAGAGDGGSTALRRTGAALARAAAGKQRLVVDLGNHAEGAGPLVEGLLLASYRPPYRGVGTGPDAPVPEIVLVGEVAHEAVVTAEVSARATCRARLLAATPSNIKNPVWLADEAVSLAGSAGGARAGLRVTVHDEAWIERTGMGGLAAVGRGSVSPPRLVVVEYRPKGATAAPVLLVGKGITYDTGGLSLKPREAMVPMKTDMSGAAITLSVVLAAAELGLPQPVVAVLPLAENAVSGSAYRPGDVIRMYDGTTVEIGNTDAEGRMVLADAMAWGREQFSPSVLVDVATLTGAASLGLGKLHAALYATTPELSAALVAAGDSAGEPLWPMPLVEEYRGALDSAIADVSHIATDTTVGGGSITAALFLQRFAGDVPWAHLDIAGPGRADADRHEVTKGPTGFSARALITWLAAR
ncbi:leucyl aminopeptidase family protein [Pseudactinotalea suaedae]|uniref:leucyl aminopeptidase family protein n=1 Tax=Pseudactinotalea suaedae TaxID=1524924 RepID=UPI0019D58023|nr:leucyl aminopeptidase family protein [Pseudactinotalea suaedae]